MAAVNLPDSPANGTTQTVGGITYTYNSSKGYWTAASSGGGGGGGGGGASVSTSDSAPSSPSDGDLWYDTDDGGMFVYYADGSSNQWVEVIGQAGATGATGATGAAGGAGTATVVADVTALMAISSPSSGDSAFVTATNTLYFYNGSGWYKIALINTTPSISGVSATYDLASDGTATTITIVASDPEGLPITYSIASDTSGNIATVAQGTGASTNVWTITPSTNTAHAGTFSLTFRASDGVNIATAAASFTLQFKVQNSKYTTALITSVGANNAINTAFDDKSTLNHTITANGHSHQTTFSPYRHGGYSAFFDGSGDYLSTPGDSSLTVGTGQFTIECWFQVDTDSQYTLFSLMNSSSANVLNVFYYHTNNNIGIVDSGFLTGNEGSGTNHNIIDLDKWYHLALVRDATTMYLYIDGALKWSASNSTNYTNDRIWVGRNQYGNDLKGYITDLRMVKGTAVYTSAFTPPTERLTAVTNTELLTCHLPYIADGSTNDHTITINGDPETRPYSPFDAKEYAAADHLGSTHFDGTGDYLTVADHADLDMGSSDFTIEGWYYPIDNPGGSADGLIAKRANSSGVGGVLLYFAAADSTPSLLVDTGGSWGINQQATGKFNVGSWNHFAIVRNGTSFKLYANGKSILSATSSATIPDNGSAFTIGAISADGSYPISKANVSDVRVVKGTAVYTSNFTPPTAPLTAVTNTKLLVQSTDAGIIDKAQVADSVILGGNAKSSTTQTKFLSSSMYFDGSGDYLAAEVDGKFFTSPWTIEMWIWAPDYTGTKAIGPSFGGGSGSWNTTNGHQWISYTYSGDLWFQYFGTNNSYNNINIGTVPLTNSTWCHWAYCWDGTTLRFFKDGTLEHSTTTFTPQDVATTNLNLGRHNNDSEYKEAYYSDVRITKGLARYTSNFTAPTAALQG